MNSQMNIPTDLISKTGYARRERGLTGTVDEKRSSTEPFNGVEGDRSRADVDEGGDQRDQEWVRDCSETLATVYQLRRLEARSKVVRTYKKVVPK